MSIRAALSRPLGPAANAFCIAAALALAVFFHGPQMILLAGAQALLVVWFALALARNYRSGIVIPRTALALWLTLFWAWLGVSLLWSPVPATSIVNFWWVGTLALVFWAYTLTPERERVWYYSTRYIWAGALALCAHALVQELLLGEPARATFINIHSFAALVMLVALPTGAAFLAALQRRAKPAVVYTLGASLFIFFFTIAITRGRGTTLSLSLGALLMAVLGARVIGWRPVMKFIGLLLGAYVAANLLLYGSVSDKMTSLADPAAAGSTRFIIWRGSWQLLMDSPWWGVGLGLYYLLWPPYRDPTDQTLGFFVHNDYLQIWIEAGLPGLLLLLATLTAALVLFVRVYRRAPAAPALKLETLGLFAGLFAIAVHSCFDFNLYILPILIVAGLGLGRLHELAAAVVGARQWVWRPMHIVQARAYRLILMLLMLFPMMYFAAIAASDYLYKRGFTLASQGDLTAADEAFAWAAQLTPLDDRVWTIHADLYRYVLRWTPAEKAAERKALYEEALTMLERAESLNPYRTLVLNVRARIVAENQALAGPDWLARVGTDYRRLLQLDPRAYQARVDYARLLIDAGREAEAYRFLKDGIQHWYLPQAALFGYLQMTAELAERQGETATARDIERHIEQVMTTLPRLATPRPAVADAALPANVSARPAN